MTRSVRSSGQTGYGRRIRTTSAATVMLGIVAIGVTSEQAADAAGLPVSGKQTTRSMADVEVIGSDDWWTVGTVSTADDERPWVRHWDGTGWDTVPTPDLGAARGGLANIAAVAADDIWAM